MTLLDEDIGIGHVKSTHAVDIFAFVEAKEVPFLYFETPYYLAPAPGGEKVYAVLRETLHRTKKIGIAHVVIQSKQHLAVLTPRGPALVLNTLRWAGDVRALGGLDFPPEDIETVDVTEEELENAAELVESMTTTWDISRYTDAVDADVLRAMQSSGTSQGSTGMLLAAVENDDDDDDLELTDDDLIGILRPSMHTPLGGARRGRSAHQPVRHGRSHRQRRPL